MSEMEVLEPVPAWLRNPRTGSAAFLGAVVDMERAAKGMRRGCVGWARRQEAQTNDLIEFILATVESTGESLPEPGRVV